MERVVKLIDMFFVCAVVWFSGFCLFNRTINNYKINLTENTDAIVVLTGGKNRISESIKLLNENLADKLFISGVYKTINIENIEESSSVTINDKSKITLGKKATNTIENAEETSEWIKKNHIKSIRLVTSYYHIPRSMEEFSAQNKGVHIVPHPVYSPNVAKDWWKKWGTFKLIAGEYTKFLIVFIKYHIPEIKEMT
ncbi:MAG: YdcF family protein [Alphaproteobacteria bacterium]|nr:YdcF family protein [Alphaproteobacteria bacterium]MBR3661814.1 YdcF family protein [Alphaproteobacteria bacterium]